MFQANVRGEAIARLTQEQAQLEQQRQELEARQLNYQQELERIDKELRSTIIRAPISGIVQGLTLRNPDQVVQVGDTIAQIAPQNDDLVVKAWVPSQDIGNVAIGQAVQMRVSACPYPDYGVLQGTVQSISPDVVGSETSPSSASFAATHPSQASHRGVYEVTIQPTQSMLKASEQECLLQSGMEGRADIVSRQETVLQFILRKARILTDL